MRQSTARLPQGVPCAVGCGELAAAGSIYCRYCHDVPGPPVEPSGDLDVEVMLLAEKLAGGGRLLRRVAKHGFALCQLCQRDALPGRLYCSDRCRWLARRGEAATIEVDGVTARPVEHAARRGIGRSTFYRRLQLGISLAEAATRPVDVAMRRVSA